MLARDLHGSGVRAPLPPERFVSLRLCRHFGSPTILRQFEPVHSIGSELVFEPVNSRWGVERTVHCQPVINALVYTRFLIRERIRLLQALDRRKKALPPTEYLSCRRSLLQGIEELKTVLPMAEYEALPSARKVRVPE